MAASQALQPPDQFSFLELVAANLQCQPQIGDGVVHRVLREAMAEFLRERPFDAKPPAGEVRTRPWVRRPTKRRRPPGPR